MFINFYGDIESASAESRISGIRPVISYSSIIKESLNGRVNNLGVYEVEYGEYPQTIVDESLSNELEKLYIENKLQQASEVYNFGELMVFEKE